MMKELEYNHLKIMQILGHEYPIEPKKPEPEKKAER